MDSLCGVGRSPCRRCPQSTRSAAPADHSVAPIPELLPALDPGPCCDGRAVDDTRGPADEGARLRRTLVDLGVTDRDRLRAELVALKNTVPRMARERDRLRTELVELNGEVPSLSHERDELLDAVTPLRAEVPSLSHERAELLDAVTPLRAEVSTLSRERDELLAAVTPLRAEVTELRTQRQELKVLRSEIEELRHQKASLDQELLSELRRSTETLRTSPTRQRFDDS